MLPQTTLLIQPSAPAESRAADLARPWGYPSGSGEHQGRTEGWGRLPARRRCSDVNVIINNHNKAIRWNIICCALLYQALPRGTGFSHFSHFADKWPQAQRAKTTHRINVKAWTECQSPDPKVRAVAVMRASISLGYQQPLCISQGPLVRDSSLPGCKELGTVLSSPPSPLFSQIPLHKVTGN